MSQPFILQELFSQELPFRVHNVKIEKLICERDLPMMFLAHYDSLPDDIKADKPLGAFLKHSTQKMTVQEASTLLDLPPNTIKTATHIKITGTSVLVLDDFPLAVHLQFTNTAKEFQTHYDNDTAKLIKAEAGRFMFSGNVHVLHKNPSHQLVSIDLSDDEFVITASETYTRLPNSHALATTHLLNTLKDNRSPLLDTVSQAIADKLSHQTS